MAKLSRKTYRRQRHMRVRAKITGTSDRPRVSVFKSNRNVFVQIIDDMARRTLASSNVTPRTKSKLKEKKTDAARKVGEMLAEKMKEQGIKKAVFDRGGYKYHGRVKAVAEGLRAGGIKV